MKKYLSLFLVLVMLMTSMPLSAFAEGEAQENAPAATEQAVQNEEQETTEEKAPEKEPEKKSEEKSEEKPAPEQSEEKEVKSEEKTEPKSEEKTEEKSAPVLVSEEPEEKPEVKTEEKTEEVTEEKTEETTEEQPTDPVIPEEGETEEEENAGETEEPSEPTEGAEGTEGEDAESAEDGEAVIPETEEDAEQEQTAAPEGELSEIEAPELLAGLGDLEQVEGVSVSTVSATSVRVRWYPVSYGDGYEVQSSANTSFTTDVTRTVKVEDISAGQQVFSNLTCGQTRYYRVRAYVDTGAEILRGPWSAVHTFRTSPSAPSYVNVEAQSASSVKLSWPKVTEATGYIVTRDGTEICRTNYNTVLSYKDTGLTTGTRYDYRVYSYKTVNGETVQGEQYAQYIDPIDGEPGYTVVPPAPKGMTAKSAGLAAITLSWKKVDSVDGYNIYRALATTESFELCGSVSGADTVTYTDSTDVATGDTYRYYVRAYVGGVESKPSEIVEGKAIPKAPTNLKAAYVNSTSIKITWDAVGGARGYILEVSDDGETYYELTHDSKTSFVDSGLSVGQERYYRVRAYVHEYGSHIDGENSAVAWEMTRPAAPTNFTLKNTRYDRIRTTWTASDGADGYQLYRSTDGSNWTLLKNFDTTDPEPTLLCTGLTCGTTYYFRVRAYVYGSDGVTRYPGPYAATLSLKAKPQAPVALGAARNGMKNEVVLSWDEVTGVDGYSIYYSANGSSPAFAKNVSSPNTTTTVTGLKQGMEYVFMILPYRNVDGATVLGGQRNSAALDLYVAKPTGLLRSAVDMTSFKVFWDAMGGVDGYKVRVESTDDPEYTYETEVSAASAIIPGVIAGYEYDCYVSAFSTVDGDKEYGAEAKITGWATPVKPTNLAVRTLYDDKGAYLTWTAVSGATGYVIYRSTSENSGFAEVAKVVGGSASSYKDYMDLSMLGSRYYYKIASYVDGVGGKTSPMTSVVSVMPQLPRPTLTMSNAGVSKAKLTWTSVDGAEGYVVYRATSSSGPFTQIASFADSSKTSCTATGLTTGTTYYFRVAAYMYDGSGNKLVGVRSLAKSIVPSPIAPTGLTGTPYAQSTYLKWNKVTGVAGYRVFRATGTGSYEAIADVTTNSYNDYNLNCDQRYHYKVAAYVYGSNGKAVGVASSEITLDTAVTKTKDLKFTVTSPTKINMTWTAVRDADGYQIQRATSETGEYTTIGHVTKNSCTISGMPTGQYRYIRIRAYVEEDGVRTYCSTWSDVKKTVSKPLAVSDLEVTGKTKSSLSVNWTKATGATGYKIYYKKASASSYTLAATLESDVTAYRVSGLASGTKHNIKIVATCEDTDGNTLNSNKSAVITATTN